MPLQPILWSTLSPDPEHLHALGARLGEALADAVVIALIGDLGAGKTTFTQGIGEGLEVSDVVVSPTFSLMNEYDGRLPLLHVDVYRLEADELAGIGLEEALESWPGVAVVEWADRFPDILPADIIWVRLRVVPEGRVLEVAAEGAAAAAVCTIWSATASV